MTPRSDLSGATPDLLLPGTDGVRIPQIGLGTWPHVGDECRAAVDTAPEAGYRHVDTAEKYGNEDAVGAAVRDSGLRRSDVFVTSTLMSASLGDGPRLHADTYGH